MYWSGRVRERRHAVGNSVDGIDVPLYLKFEKYSSQVFTRTSILTVSVSLDPMVVEIPRTSGISVT